jgi:hypothetical protein
MLRLLLLLLLLLLYSLEVWPLLQLLLLLSHLLEMAVGRFMPGEVQSCSIK